MSKAKEFERLAKAITDCIWLAEESRVITGPPYHERSYPLPDTKDDANFIVFCANNRDLIARALRLLERLENPSTAFVLRIAHKIDDGMVDTRGIFAAIAEEHDAER